MGILEQLINFQNVIFCLAIVAAVYIQRKAFELILAKFRKNITNSKWWREFFVPFGPIGTGIILAMIPGLPIPALFASALGSKAVFGAGLGLVSGFVFRVLKKMLFERFGIEPNKADNFEINKMLDDIIEQGKEHINK